MSTNLRDKLAIDSSVVDVINKALTNPDNELVNRFLQVVEKFGTPDEINAKAEKAHQLDNLMLRLKKENSPYVEDLEWLQKMRDGNAFVSLADYRKASIGGTASGDFEGQGVMMEISACQYFPWLIKEAQHAIKHREIMPGRFIRVRNMVESAQDHGDLLAMMAAMEIMGTSYVETLDTLGTDGANIHLNGPDTLLGYFTGPGMPNDYPLKWLEEYLHYYTEYGVRQVLSVNPGVSLLAYWLKRIGVDAEVKLSVLAGTDNPWFFMQELLVAKMFAGEDNKTPLVGMNPTNACNADTLRMFGQARDMMGMTDFVRIEHHVTNFYHNVVKQPFLARDTVVEVASDVKNMAAKHEGADPEIDAKRSHPTCMTDYFRSKEDLVETGDMAACELSYMDKHEAVNRTARALTKKGLPFGAAPLLHK